MNWNCLKKLFIILFLIAFSSTGIKAKNVLSEITKTNSGSQAQEPIVSTEIEDVGRKISNLLLVDKSEITFDGQYVFEVNGNDQLTSKERADTINSKLDKFLMQVNRGQIQTAPKIEIKQKKDYEIISINDEYLLTVTQEDLQNSKYLNLTDLSKSWAYELEAAFEQAISERLNDYAPKALTKAALIFLLAIFASFALSYLAKKALKGKMAIILIGLWLFAIVKTLGLFPQTRAWQYVLERGILKPLFILLLTIWLVTILNKISYLLINWYFRNQLPETWSATNRKLNRAITLKKVAEATSDWILNVLGALTFLVVIGINIASVATGAGIIGLAVGFIAQDLIKGILNGFAILLEDQFGVGDVIRVGAYAGVVEDFSLRVTRLRNMEGILITIPNKDIGVVENLTNNFSQVDFCVGVDYSSDLIEALRVLEETGKQLAREWPDKILQDPEILGVDKLAEYSIVLRMAIKTLPMQQWRVSRELNLRVVEAFARAGIKIPFPCREVRVEQGSNTKQISEIV